MPYNNSNPYATQRYKAQAPTIEVQRDSAEWQALRKIISNNHVDAWDMGFEGQLNPGQIDEAVQIFLNRFGFKQAKPILQNLKKR